MESGEDSAGESSTSPCAAAPGHRSLSSSPAAAASHFDGLAVYLFRAIFLSLIHFELARLAAGTTVDTLQWRKGVAIEDGRFWRLKTHGYCRFPSKA